MSVDGGDTAGFTYHVDESEYEPPDAEDDIVYLGE